jgi:hypothetical protein
MISNLKNLKDEYLTKGGEDPDFIKKVNDLENFLLYRKPLDKKEPYKPGHPPQINEIHVSQSPALPVLPPPGMPPYAYPPPLGMPPVPGALSGPLGLPPPVPGMLPGMFPPYGDPMMMQMNQMLQ